MGERLKNDKAINGASSCSQAFPRGGVERGDLLDHNLKWLIGNEAGNRQWKRSFHYAIENGDLSAFQSPLKASTAAVISPSSVPTDHNIMSIVRHG